MTSMVILASTSKVESLSCSQVPIQSYGVRFMISVLGSCSAAFAQRSMHSHV